MLNGNQGEGLLNKIQKRIVSDSNAMAGIFGLYGSESLFTLLFRLSNVENVKILSHSPQFITVHTLLFWFVLILFTTPYLFVDSFVSS